MHWACLRGGRNVGRLTGAWTLAIASASATTLAFTVNSPVRNDVTISSFAPSAPVSEVELKPDVKATSFSAQNGFFFSKMSKLVYSPRIEVESAMQGKDGLGYEHFHWFEADPAVSGASIWDRIQDTEAFVAANDDVILVVFRGSSELTDWTTNFNLVRRLVPSDWLLDGLGCDVHQGFDDAVETVWNPGSAHPSGMRNIIKTLCKEEGKHRKLYLAGHSLGGALATVAAARLAFMDDVKISGIYTIGSPRVFGENMADRFNAKMNDGTRMKDKYFRCRNNNDLVTRGPLRPYKHVGTEIYFDRFGGLSTSTLLDRILGRFSALLRFSLVDGANDHGAGEYIRLFKQTVIDERVPLLDKAKSLAVDAVQKVAPVDEKAAKTQKDEIETAKKAVLKASKETFVPTKIPGSAPDYKDTPEP
ncbi:unnamed protein product [Ectocarpus sp. CCAP 1310/34]|nr:unnamed protein product [Ectocarpus sp. CCAP 1310/34]